MNESVVTEADLLSWIKQCVAESDFNDFQINLTGKSEKGDGYLGEIAFASVNGSTKDNGRKSIDFVIKYSKSNDYLRKVSPVKDAFETEIHFYEKVMPVFERMQIEKNLRDKFKSVPKCHKTLMTGNMEILVLDNLKKRGYELHDRLKPLNFSHIEAVLKEYGKLHALSFALRDQHREKFESITSNRPDVYKEFLTNESLRQTVNKIVDEVVDLMQERKEPSLAEKFKNLFTTHPAETLMNLIEEEEPQSVIIHGDCWNNNFMFKYEIKLHRLYPDHSVRLVVLVIDTLGGSRHTLLSELKTIQACRDAAEVLADRMHVILGSNGERTSPSKVAILDWQISALRSPVFDLGYLIYATSSKKELDRFNELMEIYYESFSNFLRDLGSNPEELFTYSDLKRHWKKYSISGFLSTPMILKFALCSQEDAPSLEDIQEGEELGDMININIAHKELYYERLRDVLRHYFETTF